MKQTTTEREAERRVSAHSQASLNSMRWKGGNSWPMTSLKTYRIKPSNKFKMSSCNPRGARQGPDKHAVRTAERRTSGARSNPYQSGMVTRWCARVLPVRASFCANGRTRPASVVELRNLSESAELSRNRPLFGKHRRSLAEVINVEAISTKQWPKLLEFGERANT